MPQSLLSSPRRRGAWRVFAALSALALVAGLSAAFVATRSEASSGGRAARQAGAKKKSAKAKPAADRDAKKAETGAPPVDASRRPATSRRLAAAPGRSEERRVGKECRPWWSLY